MLELKDIQAILIIRARIKFFKPAVASEIESPTWMAQKALFSTMRTHWPELDKSRSFRHALIMALIGRPITTQNGLTWYEVKALLEVLNNESFFPIDGGSAGRIQAAVEGEFAGVPWTIPVELPEVSG